jgi:TonB family protein
LTRKLTISILLFLFCSPFISSQTSAQDDPAVKASKLLKDRDYDEAIDFLTEYLERSIDTSRLYPLLSKAYVGRGDKFSFDKKYADALSAYQSALKYSQDTTAYSGLLNSYWYLQKDSALLDLSRSLRTSLPDFYEPRGYIAGAFADQGYSLEANGKYSEAISMFNQSILARGWDTGLMVNEIGECYEQMNDTNSAIAAYKRECTDSNFSALAASGLVAIYQRRNEDDSVRIVLQQGINYDPTYSLLWHHLVKLYGRTNSRPEALECKKILARLGDKLQKDSLSHAGISYDIIDVTKFPWLNANFVSRIDSTMKRSEESDFKEIEKQPVPAKRVMPDYPDNARKKNLEGTVWVKCLISRRGDVLKAIVVKSDNPIFDEPSLGAMKQWKFVAASFKGKPVAVWVLMPFRFKIN